MQGIDLQYRFPAHRGVAWFSTFSPSSSLLATGGSDELVKLWNLDTKELVSTLKHHKGTVHCGAFSSNGQLFATCSSDKTAAVMSTESGQIMSHITSHNFGVTWCCFSPDSKVLCTCSWDNTALLSCPRTGNSLSLLQGHRSPVTCADFSPSGLLATSSWDRHIRLWDVVKGSSCPMTGHTDVVWSVSFNPTTPHVLASVSRDKTTCIWDTRMAGRVKTMESESMTVARYSPDGGRLVSVGNDATILIRDANHLECSVKQTGAHTGLIYNVSFSADSQLLSTACVNGEVAVWGPSQDKDEVDLLSTILDKSNLFSDAIMES